MNKSYNEKDLHKIYIKASSIKYEITRTLEVDLNPFWVLENFRCTWSKFGNILTETIKV